MRQMIAITPSSLSRLMKHARLFSYISSSLTKTYCDISGDKMLLYFKGPKSVMTFSMTLDNPIPKPMCFSVDINKLLSAVKKVGEANTPLTIQISDNPPNITLCSSTTPDKITFSATHYDRTGSEISSLLTFFADKASMFSKAISLEITQDILDFASVTSTFMATINKNNAINIKEDKLMYADRTIIVSMHTPICKTPIDVKLHKFILGFTEFVIEEGKVLEFSNDNNFIRWKSSVDPDFQSILAIDPCVISIPDQADVEAISPEASEKMDITLSPASLLNSIDFFSGLFEASVWKPITFLWSNQTSQNKIMLTYKHPSTEVEKEPVNYTVTGSLKDMEASFTLISDSLRILLMKMDPLGSAVLSFNAKKPEEAHGAGINFKYYTKDNVLLYDAVLAKLQDN